MLMSKRCYRFGSRVDPALTGYGMAHDQRKLMESIRIVGANRLSDL